LATSSLSLLHVSDEKKKGPLDAASLLKKVSDHAVSKLKKNLQNYEGMLSSLLGKNEATRMLFPQRLLVYLSPLFDAYQALQEQQKQGASFDYHTHYKAFESTIERVLMQLGAYPNERMYAVKRVEQGCLIDEVPRLSLNALKHELINLFRAADEEIKNKNPNFIHSMDSGSGALDQIENVQYFAKVLQEHTLFLDNIKQTMTLQQRETVRMIKQCETAAITIAHEYKKIETLSPADAEQIVEDFAKQAMSLTAQLVPVSIIQDAYNEYLPANKNYLQGMPPRLMNPNHQSLNEQEQLLVSEDQRLLAVWGENLSAQNTFTQAGKTVFFMCLGTAFPAIGMISSVATNVMSISEKFNAHMNTCILSQTGILDVGDIKKTKDEMNTAVAFFVIDIVFMAAGHGVSKAFESYRRTRLLKQASHISKDVEYANWTAERQKIFQYFFAQNYYEKTVEKSMLAHQVISSDKIGQQVLRTYSEVENGLSKSLAQLDKNRHLITQTKNLLNNITELSIKIQATASKIHSLENSMKGGPLSAEALTALSHEYVLLQGLSKEFDISVHALKQCKRVSRVLASTDEVLYPISKYLKDVFKKDPINRIQAITAKLLEASRDKIKKEIGEHISGQKQPEEPEKISSKLNENISTTVDTLDFLDEHIISDSIRSVLGSFSKLLKLISVLEPKKRDVVKT